MMSFTSDIRDFSKGRLRSTTTNVTHLDGSKWLETRPSDEHGYVVSRSLDDSSNTGYGYVLDVIPDLQIGWILPNLLLGQCDDLSHAHSFSSRLPGEPGSTFYLLKILVENSDFFIRLVGCPLNFPSTFPPRLFVLPGQTKSFHILLDTIPPCLPWMSHFHRCAVFKVMPKTSPAGAYKLCYTWLKRL